MSNRVNSLWSRKPSRRPLLSAAQLGGAISAGLLVLVLSIAPTQAQESTLEVGEKFNAEQRDQQIAEALNRSIRLDVKEVGLQDFVNALAEQLDVPISLDILSLEEVGIELSMPVSVKVKNASVRAALRAALNDYDLTYMIKNDSLVITTPEAAEANLRLHVYNVSDLVDSATKSRIQARYESDDVVVRIQIIETITNTIHVEDWDEVGGAGHIEPLLLGDMVYLVVSQTEEVHEGIQYMLEKVRSERGRSESSSVGGAAKANIVLPNAG